MGRLEEDLGIKLRDDLLKPLGDTWCLYNSPSEGGLVITGLTAVVPLRDPPRFAKTLAQLAATARGLLANQPGDPPRIQLTSFELPAGKSTF